MKIVNDLDHQGIIETIRGRGGGLRLRKRPAEIRVDDIVRNCETDFRLVECFDRHTNACSPISTSRLQRLFGSALQPTSANWTPRRWPTSPAPCRWHAAASAGARKVTSMIGPVTRRRVAAKPWPRT